MLALYDRLEAELSKIAEDRFAELADEYGIAEEETR